MALHIEDLPLPDEKDYACPSCGTLFAQPKGRGRKRKYCSGACRKREFRRTQRATKLTDDERIALIKTNKAVGNWQFLDLWPEWPDYTCLACGAAIGETTPAYYDRNDWDQSSGKYRRHLCVPCYTRPEVARG